MADVVVIPRKRATPRPKLVHQFLVVLSGTDPLVWRRIQVPERYSFWDLHVAIQDAMGWLDSHLHEFRLLDAAERSVVSIGIPTDDDPEDRPVVPGWKVSLSKFVDRRGWHAPPAMYAYDFGDDWQHVLVHEGLESADDSRSYPRCVAGEGRCPPEDCGGVHGYAEFLQIVADPDHEEHESTLQWAGGNVDPGAFDPAAVKFDDRRSGGRRRSDAGSEVGVRSRRATLVVGVLAVRIGAGRRQGRSIGTPTRVQGVWRHRTRSPRIDEVVSKIVPDTQPNLYILFFIGGWPSRGRDPAGRSLRDRRHA